MLIKFLNNAEWDAKVKSALSAVGNLRPVFTAIARMWYKDNAQIFELKSKGQYEDYKIPKKWNKGRPTPYMLRKMKALGSASAYPLLRFGGRLANSILNAGSEDAVQQITNTTLVLGTDTPYAIYHQLGTDTMPARPPIINKAAKGKVKGMFEQRITNYSRLIDVYLKRQVKGAFKK